MNMAIKCVIFDVGGVLTKENIDKVHQSLNKDLGKKVFDRKDKLHRKALLGKLSEKDFFRALSKKHMIPARYLASISDARYPEIVRNNEDVLGIARRARRNGYRICILSNVTYQHKRHNKAMGLYKDFHGKILSCDAGAIKPHKRIFKIALEKLGAKPEECIYIEDRKEFLGTSRKLGMNGIHFRNAKQLRRDLKKFGVKI